MILDSFYKNIETRINSSAITAKTTTQMYTVLCGGFIRNHQLAGTSHILIQALWHMQILYSTYYSMWYFLLYTYFLALH